MARSFTTLNLEQIAKNIRLRSQSNAEIVAEYVALQFPPIGRRVKLLKIGLLNPEESMGLTYGMFRSVDSKNFPECTDPTLDYMDSEDVSPVILTADVDGRQTTFRVPMLLWFPLKDVCLGIQTRQGRTGRKALPIWVTFDENHKWLVPLFNLCDNVDGRIYTDVSLSQEEKYRPA